MTIPIQTIVDAAMHLSETDRVALVDHLLESLLLDGNDVSDEELAAELDRRLNEFQGNPSSAVPWSVLQQE